MCAAILLFKLKVAYAIGLELLLESGLLAHALQLFGVDLLLFAFLLRSIRALHRRVHVGLSHLKHFFLLFLGGFRVVLEHAFLHVSLMLYVSRLLVINVADAKHGLQNSQLRNYLGEDRLLQGILAFLRLLFIFGRRKNETH